MKKLVSILLCAIMLMSTFVCTSVFADSIKVVINGENLKMDQPPVLESDRTLVPMRAIFEALGAKVSWNNDTETATGVKNGKEIKITINNTTAYVDGKAVTLDVPARLINDRTLVPVRFISESLGQKVDWDNDTETVIITTPGMVLYDETFDDLEKLKYGQQYIVGGSYGGDKVALTTDIDHTAGGGKSVKMGERTAMNSRFKLMNAFEGAQMGQTYRVSAWVYSPTSAQGVRLGVYGDAGTEVAINSPKTYKEDIPANKWVKLELEYVYADELITQVGIDQLNSSNSFVPTIYVDDVKVENTNKNAVNVMHIYDIPVTEREGKRPTPNITDTGKGYDDLIFYDREFEALDTRTPDDKFNALPKDAVVVMDNNNAFTGYKGGEGTYATFETIDVAPEDGVPFNKALKVKVTTVPTNSYMVETVVGTLDTSKFKDGDNMLLIAYVRTDDAHNEMLLGSTFICVQNASGSRVAEGLIKASKSTEWTKVYIPFKADTTKVNVNAKFGYLLQEQVVGGFKVINYGTDVAYDELPASISKAEYDKRDLFDKNVDWRTEAWDRIDKIRKGDIKVVVKDAKGNIIPNADVKLDMYDHEFHWGSLAEGFSASEMGKESAEIKRYGTKLLFNTVVSATSHKWNNYEKDREGAMAVIDNAHAAGIKYYRGHLLVSDSFSKQIDADGNYKESSVVPEDTARLAAAGKYDELMQRIKDHIFDQAGAFKGKVVDWDVTNEICQTYNQDLRIKLGNEVVKQWYDWAREADPNAKLYLNETGITGEENGRADMFYTLVKNLLDIGTQIDAIGVQGHMNTFISPKAFYDEMMLLASLGLDMKITEFDFPKEMYEADPEAEASMMRDIMILIFSIENFEGFTLWGHNEWHWRQNAPIFDNSWNVKPCGEQFMDLVYNKWWTQENGKTDANGTYLTRGYYGDYLITATANGKTATVDTQCYKGEDNTIEIVLK